MYKHVSKTLSLAILLGVVIIGVNSAPTRAAAPMVIRTAEIQAAPIKQPDPLDLWLDRLARHESQNQEQVKVLDSNGYFSYGCLQFQLPTFSSYVHRYNLLPEAGDKELRSVIYDCAFQKQLARKMLLEDSGNWQHWYTSVKTKGLGLPPVEAARKPNDRVAVRTN